MDFRLSLPFVIFVVGISAVFSHSVHHNHQHQNHHHQNQQQQIQKNGTGHKTVPPVGESPPVPIEYLQAFRDFSTSLMKQSSYYDSVHETGAVCYCPFTLGYLLAVIQGDSRVVDVPVQSFRNILNLNDKENVTDAYSAIAHSFFEDVKVSATSTYYTEGNVVPDVETYKELHHVQVSIPLSGNSAPASQIINQEIQKNTKDAIVNRVVPTDPNFDENTLGVFANTFYYKAGWETPFTPVGMKPFIVEADKVKETQSMKTVAKFRTIESEKYTSVSVPLLGGRKRIVFVQPKTSLKDYVATTVQEIFESCPRSWSKRQVTLQVPIMNLVLGRDFLEQLDQLAGNPTQCTVNSTGFKHFLQPIVQAVSCKITPDGYELAVSNGVQVNKVPVLPAVDQLRKPAQRSDMNMMPMANTEDETMTTMEQRQVPLIKSRQLTNPEQIEEVGTTEQPELPPIDLTFDKPFFIYLHDNNLGPVSFSAIESLFDTTAPSSHNHARRSMDTMEKMNMNPMPKMDMNPMAKMDMNPMPKMNTNPMEKMDMNPMEKMEINPMAKMHMNPMAKMDMNPMEKMDMNPMVNMKMNPTARHHVPGHDDTDNFTEKSKTERWTCHSSH